MNYELTKCVIAGQVDRIRGETNIIVPVTCTFKVGAREYQVSGVASVADADSISLAIPEAVKNAKEHFEKMFTVQATESTGTPTINPNLSKVMKLAISTNVEEKVKKCKSRDEYDKMMEPAGEHLQHKITGLCEALGIDIIDVLTDEWSSIEVLVLSNYLEKMTESFTG